VSVTLRDGFGRSIEYLRISVTDRCNFRCLYCMPLSGLEWLPKSGILTYEEIAEVVSQLAPLGLRRLRITGGEPTLRPDLPIRPCRTRSHQHERRLSPAG
jgi:cyclic pyranopterin phosphate synthase